MFATSNFLAIYIFTDIHILPIHACPTFIEPRPLIFRCKLLRLVFASDNRWLVRVISHRTLPQRSVIGISYWGKQVKCQASATPIRAGSIVYRADAGNASNHVTTYDEYGQPVDRDFARLEIRPDRAGLLTQGAIAFMDEIRAIFRSQSNAPAVTRELDNPRLKTPLLESENE